MAPGVLFCRKSNVSIPSKQQAVPHLKQGAPPAAVAVCCKREKCKRILKAIPHNSKCRYGERGAADAKPKAQIILDAAKVSAMRVPQPDIIEHFGNADAVPQPPERCLSRQAGIVRCCLKTESLRLLAQCSRRFSVKFPIHPKLMAK